MLNDLENKIILYADGYAEVAIFSDCINVVNIPKI